MELNRKKLIIGITADASVELIHGQLKYFVGQGYDVYLMAPGTDRTRAFIEKEGAKLLPIEIERTISPLKDLKSLFQIKKILKEVKPDIVNFGTPKVSLLGMMAAKMTGVPFRIYTCRGFRFEHEKGMKRKFLISLEKVTAKCAHKIICISNSVKDLGIKEGIFTAKKTLTIGRGSSNGINLDIFYPRQNEQAKLAEMRENYKLGDNFVFGFVGRIVDRKGIKELYEAFDKYHSENKNTRLLVVGAPYWDQIADKTLIDKFNAHPGIVMAGLQPHNEVPYFLSLMDTFILPAWWEGFGNVLIQAAATGIPIITTDSTGCKDAVSNGFNGKFVPPHEIGALVDMMRYFHTHPEEIKVFGENGLKWAQNFRSETIWKGMQDIYENTAK